MNSANKVLRVNAEFDQMSDEALLRNLREGTANIRQLAATALAARLSAKPYLADAIFESIERPENQQAVVMGVFTVAMIGAIAVLENGSASAYPRLKQAIASLPPAQRADLFDYLQLATQIDYEPLLMAA